MTRVSAALVIGAPLLVGACAAESTTPPAEVRPVRTVVVDPKPIDDDRQAVGEMRPRYESDIGFRVAGKIVARAVDVGVSVRRATCWRGSTSRTIGTSCKSARRRHRRRAKPCWSRRRRRGPRCANCWRAA